MVATTGAIDSVKVVLNNTHSLTITDKQTKITSDKPFLGENVLVGLAYKNGKVEARKYHLFSVKTNHKPAHWKPKVLKKIKHGNDEFTQGLFIHNGKLYETTGERGHSKLLKKDLTTGKILQTKKLPNSYFGEGATVIGSTIYYITWTSGQGFTFDAETFQQTGDFMYSKYTKEGWGLTTVKNSLVMSNGSEKLLFFDPITIQLQKSLSVISNKGVHKMLNELEYDGTYIYANVWQENEILVINPKSGKVEAIIDCSDLVHQEKTAHNNPLDDVLNGIAYNPKKKTFLLTGKNWNTMYEVIFIKK